MRVLVLLVAMLSAIVRGDSKKKNRKKRKQRVFSPAGRKDVPGVSAVESDKVSDVSAGQGFWNSCTADVRQRLIDSKANMHITENDRKARENVERIDQMDSPENAIRHVIRLLDLSSKQKEKSDKSKISLWAQNVVMGHAETIAKTVPSTYSTLESAVEDVVASQEKKGFGEDLAMMITRMAQLENEVKMAASKSVESSGQSMVSEREHKLVLERVAFLEREVSKKSSTEVQGHSEFEENQKLVQIAPIGHAAKKSAGKSNASRKNGRATVALTAKQEQEAMEIRILAYEKQFGNKSSDSSDPAKSGGVRCDEVRPGMNSGFRVEEEKKKEKPQEVRRTQTMTVNTDSSTFASSVGIKGFGSNYDKMMANNEITKQFVDSGKKGWFG